MREEYVSIGDGGHKSRCIALLDIHPPFMAPYAHDVHCLALVISHYRWMICCNVVISDSGRFVKSWISFRSPCWTVWYVRRIPVRWSWNFAKVPSIFEALLDKYPISNRCVKLCWLNRRIAWNNCDSDTLKNGGSQRIISKTSPTYLCRYRSYLTKWA